MPRVSACYIGWEELEVFDPQGIIFMNINTEEELIEAENLLGKHE